MITMIGYISNSFTASGRVEGIKLDLIMKGRTLYYATFMAVVVRRASKSSVAEPREYITVT